MVKEGGKYAVIETKKQSELGVKENALVTENDRQLMIAVQGGQGRRDHEQVI